MDWAVNKPNLSTGETRESAHEILPPQTEPGLNAHSRHARPKTREVGGGKYL